MTEDSTGHPAARAAADRDSLENDAEMMSNTQLEEQLAGQPAARRGRDPRASTPTRGTRSLQIALLVPLLAALLGLVNSFRMLRRPTRSPVGGRRKQLAMG